MEKFQKFVKLFKGSVVWKLNIQEDLYFLRLHLIYYYKNFFITEIISEIINEIIRERIKDTFIIVYVGPSFFGSNIKKSTGSGITLTNNEIKDIMKVIKSLENRGI